jgi:ERCC4-type nuclease
MSKHQIREVADWEATVKMMAAISQRQEDDQELESLIKLANKEVADYKEVLEAVQKRAKETNSAAERRLLLRGMKAVTAAQMWVRELMLTVGEGAGHAAP